MNKCLDQQTENEKKGAAAKNSAQDEEDDEGTILIQTDRARAARAASDAVLQSAKPKNTSAR